jgi:hypothetical protein
VRDSVLLIAHVWQRAGPGEKAKKVRIDQVTPDDVELFETDNDALHQPLQCETRPATRRAAIETGYTASSIRIFASSAGLERNGE